MTRTTTDDLVFAPLGGVGEIGMNLALYGYGSAKQRKWLIVDFGISFPGPHQPGVDVIFPDIAFIEKNLKDIVGIVITHAHEDHYGALLELWPSIRKPVYCTAFVAGLLNAKSSSYGEYEAVPTEIVAQGAKIDIGPFNVEFIAVSHSIPEPNALLITTDAGRVLHTGDWKLDPTPGAGLPTDVRRFKEIGESGGVDTMICDSTNAMRDGVSPSEAEIQENLTRIIKGAKHRVAVTSFSSNVARIRAVALAAKAADRQVVLMGAAMRRVVDVSRELGFLDDVPPFISAAEYGYLPREKVVVLLTGSQGESRAALARIARDDHNEIAFSKGDLVIFSSRAIPGNEKVIGDIINQLVADGLEVITDKEEVVHVTGHPRRNELLQMYQWVKPRSLIPVHGEAMHLRSQARLAMEAGIRDVMVIENGDVIHIAPDALRKVDEIPAGILVRDGRLIRDEVGAGVPLRRKLAFAGVVNVAIVIDAKGGIPDDPAVEIIGLPLEDDEDERIEDVLFEVVLSTLEGLPAKKRRDEALVREAVFKAVRSKVNQIWGKKPLCSVLLLRA
ncbi:MAG: ribonuclease J [Rhizobiales bacterium]|nr:ribonuclease J [Hyphomicrobiales bacterium]